MHGPPWHPPCPVLAQDAAVRTALRILLVDEDAGSRRACVEILRRASYRVTSAASFEEARRALARRPDVLITDVRLGAYNGLQLVIRGRALNPRLVPVVTGFPDASLKEEAARLGAAYLETPIEPARLLRSITALCQRSGSDLRC
jgi:two-component system, OmpR family, phosphate regulon response regulator OmpR